MFLYGIAITSSSYGNLIVHMFILAAIHCAEPTPGALVLDMPKINFKRAEGGNDRLFQSCFPGGVAYLPQSSSQQQQAANQNLNNDCRVEEIEQDFQPVQEEQPENISTQSGDSQESKS